jgi:outer membrane lipoprotein-sorting protein
MFVMAGCLGAPGTEVNDSSAVANQVESRYERLEGFQSTMVRQVEVENKTRTSRASVTFDKGDSLRVAYHTGPNAGEVTTVENSSAKLFTGERTDSESEASALYGTIAADLVREEEVVFEGRDRYDGRPVAIFSITPPKNASENRSERRVWVDVDRMVPLRIESTWTEDGTHVHETLRFENVSLEAPEQRSDTTSTGGATA